MEKNLGFAEKLKLEFQCEEVDIKTYSPLTLAFIGDCVFDLIVRSVIVSRGNRPTQSLHKMKSEFVKAKTQCDLAEAIYEELEEEEQAVYRRGRNAKSYSNAKNATVADYRKATGFEALVGYLYLQGREERIIELTKIGLKKLELEL